MLWHLTRAEMLRGFMNQAALRITQTLKNIRWPGYTATQEHCQAIVEAQ